MSKEQSPKSEKAELEKSEILNVNTVGSIMYSMVCTRPDIAFALGVLSRFMSKPGIYHWHAVKWLLRCIRGNVDKGL